MQEKYSWKNVPPAKGIEPETAAEEITRIIAVHGHATPQIIVQEAEHEESPLHRCFEWDDSVAAKMYRVEQAKYILRAIVVTVEKEDRPPVRIRAFHNVVEDDVRCYTTVKHARQTPELWRQVVEKAKAELKSWRQTYQHIKEFETIFEVVDQFV